MKLRWCTLGPQFDWTARVYDTKQPYKPLPAELHALACRLSASAAKHLPDRAGMHSPTAAQACHLGDLLSFPVLMSFGGFYPSSSDG